MKKHPKSGDPYRIIETEDASHTLLSAATGETYHSRHGAIQESVHVFIRNGFLLTEKNPLHILEIGFGTGLNALLTWLEAGRTGRQVSYTALERFPLPEEVISRLNYCRRLDADEKIFRRMHAAPWDREEPLTGGFSLLKLHDDLLTCPLSGNYDLVYFDAFSASAQPELWTPEVFAKIAAAMTGGGSLVTYAAKGSVKRALRQNGFEVFTLPGPPGKREMVRAVWKEACRRQE